jgi:RNA polymerase sigma-54 factor
MHLSGYALQEYIANEMELNPVLEKEDETDSEELDNKSDNETKELDLDLWPDDDDLFEKNYNQHSANTDFHETPVVHYNSLQENLKEQIQMMNISEELSEIANYIVDELNEEAFLRRPISEVAIDYGFFKGKLADEQKIIEALLIVQKCEPTGVGARDIRECLKLQLNKLSTKKNPTQLLSVKILNEYYNEFVQHQFQNIKTALEISNEELHKCIQCIRKLNPSPVTETNHYELLKEQLIPDFEVFMEDSDLYVSLNNSEYSKLRINRDYANSILGTVCNKEKKQLSSYFNNLVKEANTLITVLKEREVTMIKTMTTIVQMQPDFFRSGDIKDLKPMILQNISRKTGLDISTISRITSNKYVQTSFGVFHLKNLFMRAIPSEGNIEVPSTSIQVQNLIWELVKKENSLTPLSDNEITQLLKKRDVTIARRTVVKYRELAGIPNSKLRKKFQHELESLSEN